MVQRTPEDKLSFSRDEIIVLSRALGNTSFGIDSKGVDHRPAEYALRKPIDNYTHELWAPNADPSSLPDSLDFDDGVAHVAKTLFKRFATDETGQYAATTTQQETAEQALADLEALTAGREPSPHQPSLEAFVFD